MIRALTVVPRSPRTARIDEIDDPVPSDGELLIEGLEIGICGTDKEIVQGQYGWAPPHRDRLVIGHESLGRVLAAPDGSDFAEGDLVVGIVRRPDPEPCGACARGEWDMCRNGKYTERGIKGIDGYAAEKWVIPPEYAVGVASLLGNRGVLLEPTSVVAKAWEQIERIGSRAWFEPRRLLVTGAGPIGLLAALLGAQRGLDVHVLDRVSGGPKPDLVRDLGGTYHSSDLAEVANRVKPDVVVEATGVDSIVLGAMNCTATYGIVCLTGVSSGARSLRIEVADLNRELVLENDCIVGSVNANRRHYQAAAEALASADQGWLDRLITRRVPLDEFESAFERNEHDVKVVLEMRAP